jgi:hypothetical protein
MFKFDYVSARGDILPLTDNPYFHLTHVDGHTTAGTSIASAIVGGVDGDFVNNIQATPRTIILDLRIKSGVDVEQAKRAILKIVKLKQQGGLIWTQGEKTVIITGIVEAVEMPRWTRETVMQITLHCEQPFWEDVDDVITQINEAINLHFFTTNPENMLYFPEDGIPFGEYDTIRTKSFYNDGDVAVGLEITIVAHGTVTNPIIYDQNGNYFGLGYEQETAAAGAGIGTAWFSNPFVMQAGDNVVITTHKGNKTVKYNGTVIYDKIKPQSTWLQLEAGDNQFSINSDDDSINNMSFSLAYRQRYI